MSYLNTPGVEWIHTTEATIVASVFATLSIFISITHIWQHLSHYTMPGIQIYVIRILIICPVYAISSALAVGLGKHGQYAEVARDVYEAFVIYSFLSLILEYCGGETDCVYQIEHEPLVKMPCPLCCMKPRQRDARLIRTLKRGVLQFVIIKPIFAVIDIVMIATGKYYLLPYQFFEMFVYNISYTWALYCMYLFYVATNKIIKKFRPVLKFASVKLIVFATYYQSILVKAVSMSPENAIMWNDLLLCIEMVVFASILMLAFPTSEFQGGVPDSRLMNNMKDVLKVKDVVQDVYHNFMPVYQEYTLQRSEKEAPETVRVKTYFAGNLDSVAIEMSHRYRGRNKRFAFNSLLRGDTPIRAQLRSRSNKFEKEEGRKQGRSVLESDDEEEFEGDPATESPTESSATEEDLFKSFCASEPPSPPTVPQRFRSNSSFDDLELSSSSDCLTANIRQNQDFDLEMGSRGGLTGCNRTNIIFQQLNPIEMDIYQRRVNFMRTHGVGLIVTDSGIETRPSSYCPSEEERVVNVDFMTKDINQLAHLRATVCPSYACPVENRAAAVLPRITSSERKGKARKEHQKRVDTAVRNEELLLLNPPPGSGENGFFATRSSLQPNRSPHSSSANLAASVLSSSQGAQKEEGAMVTEQRLLQQQQLEKMKLLPPITAISAPRRVAYTSGAVNRGAGLRAEADEWGDFQGNGAAQHGSHGSQVEDLSASDNVSSAVDNEARGAATANPLHGVRSQDVMRCDGSSGNEEDDSSPSTVTNPLVVHSM